MTKLKMAIIIMTTGPVIDTMIGHILLMGIVGVMKVGTARMIEGLSVIHLLEDLATRSSMVLCIDPGWGRGSAAPRSSAGGLSATSGNSQGLEELAMAWLLPLGD